MVLELSLIRVISSGKNFSFTHFAAVVLSLQIFFLIPPGTYHYWVDRGCIIWEACPTHPQLASSVTQDWSPIQVLTRLGATQLQWSDRNWLPLSHVLPHIKDNCTIRQSHLSLIHKVANFTQHKEMETHSHKVTGNWCWTSLSMMLLKGWVCVLFNDTWFQ